VAVFPGANSRVTSQFIEERADVIRGARVVMVQLEIPLEAAARAIELARSAGAAVVFDPSPARALPPELLGAATIIKVNAAEAAVLTGIRVDGVASARAAARRLLGFGARLVAVEAGSEGNLFVASGEENFVPLHDLVPVDRTGAGDAMAGALAMAAGERWSLPDAARFAAAAAALATRALGGPPAMPYRHEIDRLVERS